MNGNHKRMNIDAMHTNIYKTTLTWKRNSNNAVDWKSKNTKTSDVTFEKHLTLNKIKYEYPLLYTTRNHASGVQNW